MALPVTVALREPAVPYRSRAATFHLLEASLLPAPTTVVRQAPVVVGVHHLAALVAPVPMAELEGPAAMVARSALRRLTAQTQMVMSLSA